MAKIESNSRFNGNRSLLRI